MINVDSLFSLPTLLVAGSIVAALGCFILIAAWRDMPRETALLWFTATLLTRTVSTLLLAAGLSWAVPMLFNAGGALMPLAATATLTGIRVFHGRAPSWWLVVLAAAWPAVMLLPIAPRLSDAGLALGMAISSGLLVKACFELWRGRAEQLTARWPLLAILALVATVVMAGAVDVAEGNEPSDIIPPLVSWFGLVQLAGLMFVLGAAVLGVMLCRQRIDAKSLAVARLDSVTGIASRGAFVARAERIIRRAAEEVVPVAVILFDLDRFKSVNDTYGHAAGDYVLRVFSKTAEDLIRPVDVIGRIGGEEFCALLSGTDAHEAYVIADRIRRAFEAKLVIFGNSVISTTVSAGVASADPGCTVDDLIGTADSALYQAKARGRNRVELADDHRRPLALPHLRHVV